MIALYSGTPGSGKSFHAVQKIYYRLRSGKDVICNFEINQNICKQNFFQYWFSKISGRTVLGKRKIGNFVYKNNFELTPDFLKQYAQQNHNRRKESQTLVVIDECGIMFNPRTFAQSDRLDWIQFFSLHRHYGYDFILISQSDRMIDRQIRSFVEYEHRHRKANNFGFGGFLIGLLTASTFFVDVKMWYGLREKVGADWVRYNRRISSLYDTMLLDDCKKESCSTPSKMGGEEQGGPIDGGVPLSSSDIPVSICSLSDDE